MRYDLIVLGGGSGGIAAARRAAQYGAKVLLLEPGRLGGTCVNVGCVPKKVMWHAADLAHAIDDAPGYGFDVKRNGHDWPRLKAARDAYVARLNEIYLKNLEKDGVELVRARGRLLGAQCVEAGDLRLQAAHILVATGTRPQNPSPVEIPGAQYGIDSDGFFLLKDCPRRVAIVGAGYIAVELSGMLRALGAETTLILRGTHPLRQFDAMLGESLLTQMRASGLAVRTGTRVLRVERGGDELELQLSSGSEIAVDCLIWAVGRVPNTDGLGLDAAGVMTDEKGFVVTDGFQNANVPGLYAVGDVTGRAPLTPVAIAAGRRLADRLFGKQAERRLDYEWIPTVVFSHPPIGTVGLSEAEARKRHGDDVKIYTGRFNPLFYGVLEHKVPSLVKLITTGSSERIVGCHVIGSGADEMLQGFAVAIRMGATKQDFDDTVAIHPTSAEELVTLR